MLPRERQRPHRPRAQRAVLAAGRHPGAVTAELRRADAAVPAAAAALQIDAAVPEVTSQPVLPIPAAPDAPRPPGRTGLN
jgi:hypothetical protein